MKEISKGNEKIYIKDCYKSQQKILQKQFIKWQI
jgi:hypothetical protein